MKLTKEQITYIENYIKSFDIKYYEVYMEILDHMILSVEAILEENKEIVITMQELGPAPAGRYYVFDLIGLQVFDTKGDNIGELRDVIDTGANDVYIIKTVNNKELLVPAIKSVIQEVDIENKKMIIEPQIWEE